MINRINITEKAIQDSTYILDLKDNWDDEGAKPYRKETWQRAIAYLLDFLKEENHPIKKIHIDHDTDGDILIELHCKDERIFIYVPEDGNVTQHYFSHFKNS